MLPGEFTVWKLICLCSQPCYYIQKEFHQDYLSFLIFGAYLTLTPGNWFHILCLDFPKMIVWSTNWGMQRWIHGQWWLESGGIRMIVMNYFCMIRISLVKLIWGFSTVPLYQRVSTVLLYWRVSPPGWVTANRNSKFYIHTRSFHFSITIPQQMLCLIQSFLKHDSIALSWMTLNWVLEGSRSLEAGVIVKVEMRTQLAGILATPAYKSSDSPPWLAKVSYDFLLLIFAETSAWFSSLTTWETVTGQLFFPPPYCSSLVFHVIKI